MDMKRIICLIAGIVFLVAGVILFYMGMGNGNITTKVGGGSIMVAGVTFLMESAKKKEHK